MSSFSSSFSDAQSRLNCLKMLAGPLRVHRLTKPHHHRGRRDVTFAQLWLTRAFSEAAIKDQVSAFPGVQFHANIAAMVLGEWANSSSQSDPSVIPTCTGATVNLFECVKPDRCMDTPLQTYVPTRGVIPALVAHLPITLTDFVCIRLRPLATLKDLLRIYARVLRRSVGRLPESVQDRLARDGDVREGPIRSMPIWRAGRIGRLCVESVSFVLEESKRACGSPRVVVRVNVCS
jgi:hypothetical protein